MTKIPKYIIDLDTGVDDAMALLVALYAHKKREIELVAITTVTGNAKIKDVVRNTFRTLEVANCEHIPVYAGSEEAMVIKYDFSPYSFHGSDGFNDIKFDWEPNVERLKKMKAVQAIQMYARMYPGEITFIALAPLTNLALALKTDPNLSTNLREIFIMGGNVEGIGNVTISSEFNFHADPEAAYAVLDSVKCPTYIVTWEMCYKYVKPCMKWRKEVLGSMQTPEAKLMNQLEQVWFDAYDFDSDHWIMCDQFAVIAAIYRDTITQTRDFKATIELGGTQSRGNMVVEQRIFKVREKDFKTNVTVIDNMDLTKIELHLINAFQGHPCCGDNSFYTHNK